MSYVTRGAVMASVWALLSGVASASVVLVQASGGITHTGNLGGSVDVRTVDIPALPNFTVPNPAIPLQLGAGTISGVGSAQSTARAGMAAVSTPNYFGIVFAPTTQLTQRFNTNTSPSTASSLRMDFAGVWRMQNSSFGPNNQAGYNLNFVVSVPTSTTNSAFVEVIGEMAFQIIPTNMPPSIIRSTITAAPPIYTRTLAGSEIVNRQNLQITVPGTLPAEALVVVQGNLRFRVHNDMDEASVELLEGNVSPTDPFAIPSPGAFALLGLGGVFAARRRR